MASDSQQYHAGRRNMALFVAIGALMAACGGGSSTTPPPQALPTPTLPPTLPPPPVSTARGALIGAPGAPTSFSTAQINSIAANSNIDTLTGPAKCGVTYRVIEYNTIGGKGEATNATAGLSIPSGTDPACQGARPLLMFARGTDTKKIEPPLEGTEREMAFFAAQGYIVISPDYTGYAGSKLAYHPYHVADAQAADAIDALRAARLAVTQLNASVSDKLFLTGVSQGGYVAMATQRALERDLSGEFKVTASAPISGVYSLKKTISDVVDGRELTYGTILMQLIVTSYQKTYGNIYEQPSDIYMAPYATGIETVSPGPYGFSELYSNGKLPLNIFDKGDGQPFLMKTSVRDNLRTNPSNPIFTAAAKNDLLDWKPQAPMMLCGTSADQTSFFSNTIEAAASFAKQGVTVPILELEIRSSLDAGAVGDAAWNHYRASRTARPGDAPHPMGHSPCLSQVFSFFKSK